MVQEDRVGDVRGMAVKVLGVPGKKIIPGMEEATTQDFLLILRRDHAVPRRERIRGARGRHASGAKLLILPRFGAVVGFGRALGIVRKLRAETSAAFLLVCRPALFQCAADPLRSVRREVCDAPGRRRAARRSGPRSVRSPTSSAHGLRRHRARVGSRGAALRRRGRDADRGQGQWSGRRATRRGFRSRGSSFRCKTPARPAGRKLSARAETLSFDPWHALEEHRPLGQMMRARSAAYRLSTMERGAAPEPSETTIG